MLTPRLVGTIVGLADPPADTCSNGTTLPTAAPIPSEIQQREMNKTPLPEPRPSSPPEYPPQSLPGGIQEVTSDAGGTIVESNSLAYDDPMRDRFHVEEQLPSVIQEQKHELCSKEVARVLDPGAGDKVTMRSPVKSPAAGTENVGSKRPGKRQRAMTPDEACKIRRILPRRVRGPESRENTRVGVAIICLKYPERD